MKKQIKLDKQGYEDYLNKIEKKEKELAKLRLYKGTDAIYQGDNWHDNPTLYQTELQEMSLMKEIQEMKQDLLNVEIVESLVDEELIDIGDIVRVNMIFSENNETEAILKLVAIDPKIDMDDNVQEVSLNSPIGNCIYHKKTGEVVTYKVNDKIFTIHIKEKVLLKLETKEEISIKKIK